MNHAIIYIIKNTQFHTNTSPKTVNRELDNQQKLHVSINFLTLIDNNDIGESFQRWITNIILNYNHFVLNPHNLI